MLLLKVLKRLNDTALLNKSSQSDGTSLVIWDHGVLPATRHKWTRPAYNPRQTSWYSINLSQRDGRLRWPIGGLELWYISRRFTCQ